MTKESTAEEVLTTLGVSRETSEKFEHYASEVIRWTKVINLISKESRSNLWQRHMLDSAQLYQYAPRSAGHWLDVGSGGGFPGIVCALLAQDAKAETTFTLVESDQRKSAFLRTIARELDLPIKVKVQRIETLPIQRADVITARALAPLSELFSLTAQHATPDATLIFPKGVRALEEIEDARQHWRFTHALHRSITNPEARIVQCSAPHQL